MILLLEGSPRKNGNGGYLADKIAEKYKDREVARYRAAALNFSDCTGCRNCRSNDTLCTVQDDLQKIYPNLLRAEAIVVITPSFYGFLTGDMKKFIDRFYCMKRPDKTMRYREGAKLLFIFTQGSPHRDKGIMAQEWMKRFCERSMLKFYGITVPNCAHGNTDAVRLKEQEILMSLGMYIG